jgi:hypothetical protein
MSRFAVVVCALGLSAGAAVAQELRLDPPTLSARNDHCSGHQRAMCEGRGQRALETGLSCDACGVPPMPAEMMAPTTPAATEKTTTSPECLPRAAGPLPSSCVKPPRIDTIPRW